MCNYQSMRYIILCNLLGFVLLHPISDGSNSENPTSTSTTKVKPNLPDTDLQQMEQYTRDQQAFPMENKETFLNQRFRRTLTHTQLAEPVDVDFDMELAEVNVFRPLFRYRAQVARNVGQRQQFG